MKRLKWVLNLQGKCALSLKISNKKCSKNTPEIWEIWTPPLLICDKHQQREKTVCENLF